MNQSTYPQTFSKTIDINAPASAVWAALTSPAIMKKWMAEADIDILTDWQVGAPFIIRGSLHGIKFENRGTVVQFDPEKRLCYTHLSSISRLPDVPESYSMLAFELDQTTLTVTISNFPTETIYKHLAFYWNVTPGILKKLIEQGEDESL
jgi:uncharacterized protein YndB with AHSA1/START domain